MCFTLGLSILVESDFDRKAYSDFEQDLRCLTSGEADRYTNSCCTRCRAKIIFEYLHGQNIVYEFGEQEHEWLGKSIGLKEIRIDSSMVDSCEKYSLKNYLSREEYVKYRGQTLIYTTTYEPWEDVFERLKI